MSIVEKVALEATNSEQISIGNVKEDIAESAVTGSADNQGPAASVACTAVPCDDPPVGLANGRPQSTSVSLGSSGPKKTSKLTLTLVLATISAVIGSAGQFGYALGMLNGIRRVIISDFQENTTCSVDFDANNDSTSESTFNFGLATALICLGGLISSLVAGRLADKFGRKRVLLANNVAALMSGFILGFARDYPTLIAGRVFQGLAAGVGLVVVSAYLGEIAPSDLRGMLGSATQVGITGAIFFATVLSLPWLLGQCDTWNVVTGTPILLSLIQLASLPFFPESPKFLYLQKGDEVGARVALRKLRGPDADIEPDIEQMKAEKAASANVEAMSFKEAFTSRDLRSRLLLIALIHASQQLSGINGVFFYGEAIYSSAGLSNVAAVSLVPSAVNIIATFVSFKLVERAGRRRLMLIGLAGLIASHLLLTAGFALNRKYFNGVQGSNWTAALTISGSLGVVIFFALGPAPIPWLFVVELFPVSALSTAYLLAGVVNWTCNYLVGQFFLNILLGLDPYGFLIFASLATFFLGAIYYFMPETKGRTSNEIDTFFKDLARDDPGLALVVPAGLKLSS